MATALPALQRLVDRLALHSPLTAHDRQLIFDLPHSIREADPHAYLVREGDPPTTCAILISGYAYRQKLTGEGERQIISVHIPGDPLDLQHLYLEVADHSVQMLTRGTVAIVPRSDLHALAEASPTLHRALIVTLLVEASIFCEWVVNVGRRDARTRLAHLLCELAVRQRAQGLVEGDSYELPMTLDQLADATGLTPVHVSRTLKTLEDEGLLKRSKRQMRFPDWDRLCTSADFAYRFLHLEPRNGSMQQSVPTRASSLSPPDKIR